MNPKRLMQLLSVVTLLAVVFIAGTLVGETPSQTTPYTIWDSVVSIVTIVGIWLMGYASGKDITED